LWAGVIATPAQGGQLSIGIKFVPWNRHPWQCGPCISEKWKQIEKKIPFFWKKCCYQIRILPIFLHFQKALGRPRRLIYPLFQRMLTGEAPRAVKCRFFRFSGFSTLTKSIFTPKSPSINGNVWYSWKGNWLGYTVRCGATIRFCVNMFQEQKKAKNCILGHFIGKNRFKTIFLISTEFIFFIRWFLREFTYQNYRRTCPGTLKWSIFGYFRPQ
jgi:hypothetical protein